MKLNILKDTSKKIENYNNIIISEDNIDLSNIVDNSCEEILCFDSLDFVAYDKINQVIGSMLSKLRLNGSLIIVGTDIRSISRLVLNETISYEEFNKEIQDKKSLSSSDNIRKFLLYNSVIIESEILRGYKYEFRITRK